MSTASTTASKPVEHDPFTGPELSAFLPITQSQREVWLASQLGENANIGYNEGLGMALEGDLQVAALKAALQTLIDRHEALRISFSPDGEQLMVRASLPLPLVELDLTRDGAPALATVLAQEMAHAFDLSAGPLLRFTLLRLGAQEHRLLFVAHHLVCDGWSGAVIITELAALYSGIVEGKSQALPAPPRYGDYCVIERDFHASAAGRQHEAYWLQTLEACPAPSSPLPDLLPPDQRSFAARRVDITLDGGLSGRLRQLGRSHGASLVATMLGGFATLLYRLTGQDDLVIGLAAAGQSFHEQPMLVGHCVNLLPLRLRLNPQQLFAETMRQASAVVLDAVDHQGVTFSQLLPKLQLARSKDDQPLVAVVFNIDVRNDDIRHAGLKVQYETLVRQGETFHLFVNVVDNGGDLVLEASYDADRYSHRYIEQVLSTYCGLLEAACTAPATALSALPLQTTNDQAQWAALNQTAVPMPEQSLCELIAASVAGADRKTAVRTAHATQSYAALSARAAAIAAALAARGAGPGQFVAVCVQRTVDLPAALLGVLRTGAAYLPLDPEFPPERLAYYLSDSGARLVLTDAASEASLADTVVEKLRLEDIDQEGQFTTVALPPQAAAYIIYTSGSTGQPKGVVVPHGALSNFLLTMRQQPGITPEDVLAAVTTISFDIAGLELWLPLISGATVVVMDRDTAMDGERVKVALVQQGVTLMQATPATWRLLLAADWQGDSRLTALSGGEPLPRAVAEALLPRVKALWNLYGPTETTVWSTVFEVLDAAQPILVGKPIANTQCHVLDANLEPLPPGITGTLWIGGAGLAQGYHVRPELTAERFVEHPQFGRLYNTGDLARLTPRGLECLGRIDQQVKLRGYRIELGEIEYALSRQAAVAESAVTLASRGGEPRLVAQVVLQAGAQASPSELQAALLRFLPHYMLPQEIRLLPALPRLPNGKLDRKALQESAADSAPNPSLRTPPQTAAEARLATIWIDALKIDAVSREDRFHEIGGHSLLAVRVLSTLQRETGVRLPLRELLFGSLAEIAARLPGLASAVDHSHASPVADAAVATVIPLTDAQREIQLAIEFDPAVSAGYQLPLCLVLTGDLQVAALHRALNEVIARHEALRGSLSADGQSLVVAPALSLELPVVDLSQQPDPAAEAARRVQSSIETPMALVDAPLIQASLYRLGTERHLLLLLCHHLIFDGLSSGVLLNEWAERYTAITGGALPLWPAAPRWGDFAQATQDAIQRNAGADLAWWQQQLQDAPGVFEWPLDTTRPAERDFATRLDSHLFSPTTAAALQAFTANGTSPLALVLAWVSAHASRLGLGDEQIIGIPASLPILLGFTGLIGHGANVLPLRLRTEPSHTFTQHLQATQQALNAALAHATPTLGTLLPTLPLLRDSSRPLLVSTVVDVVFDADASAFGTLTAEERTLSVGSEFFELLFRFKLGRSGLQLDLLHSPLYSSESVQRRISELERLLGAAVAEPTAPISALPLLTDTQTATLQQGGLRTQPVPDQPLHTLLLATAARQPEATAVLFGEARQSYAELAEASARIAQALRQHGAAAGADVAVCLERALEVPAALLGVLRSGAGYVALDPIFPPQRVRSIVEQAGVRVLLTQAALREQFADLPCTVLCVEDLLAGAEAIDHAALAAVNVQGSDAAYIVFTSGSTGTPKGVVLTHAGVVNCLTSLQREPGLRPDETALAVATLAFDFSVYEIFLPLLVGARLVIADLETTADGTRLKALIEQHGITSIHATPATMRLLQGAGWQGKADLRMVFGGESLPRDLVGWLLPRIAEVWNIYGPTETTITSNLCRITSAEGVIPVGAPIANVYCRVLDAQQQLLPIGAAGELYIGGAGVGRGYLNQPAMTAERFVADPHLAGGRLYRSGDLARWLADGQIEILGRIDRQVKLRGYRVELGEIEYALAQQPEVAEAVAAVLERSPGDLRLVAYLSLRDSAEAPSPSKLRNALRTLLPAYMVPQQFVTLPQLPRLANGKLDRKQLPNPFEQERAASEVRTPPATAAEKSLAAIWAEVLGVQAISIEDRFSELGGHSLLAVQAAARIQAHFGTKPSLRSVLIDPLSVQAAALAGSSAETGSAEPQRRGVSGRSAADITVPVRAPAAKPRGWFARLFGA